MFKLRKNAIIEEYVHLFIFKMGGQLASRYLIDFCDFFGPNLDPN